MDWHVLAVSRLLMKTNRMILKSVGIVLVGVVSSLLGLSFFVTVDVVAMNLGLFQINDSAGVVARSDWIYFPLICALDSFLVSILSRRPLRFLLCILALVPLLAAWLYSSSHSLSSIVFVVGYFTMALAVAAIIPSASNEPMKEM